MLYTIILAFLHITLLNVNSNDKEVFDVSFEKINTQMYSLNQLEEKVLNHTATTQDSIQSVNKKKSFYEMGIRDAQDLYFYPAHFISSFLISGSIPFAFGFLGGIAVEDACCVPMIAVIFAIPSPLIIMMVQSEKPVNIDTFFLPDESLIDNEEYMKGFKKVVRKKRNNNSIYGSIIGALLGIVSSGVFTLYLEENFFF